MILSFGIRSSEAAVIHLHDPNLSGLPRQVHSGGSGSPVNIGITDVLAKWAGESEQRLHELFERARRLEPAVIFIDELDALGIRRDEALGSGIRTLINQLLTELDGISTDHEKVMVLAATNAPWHVDSSSAARSVTGYSRHEFVGVYHAPAELAHFVLDIEPMASPQSPLVYPRKHTIRCPTIPFTTVEDDPYIAPVLKVPA